MDKSSGYYYLKRMVIFSCTMLFCDYFKMVLYMSYYEKCQCLLATQKNMLSEPERITLSEPETNNAFRTWGVRPKSYYAFFLVCCGCDTSYIVSVHIQCLATIYTFVVSRTFMVGAASQAGDADSSRAPGPTSWCSIVGATVTVHQFFCILHWE